MDRKNGSGHCYEARRRQSWPSLREDDLVPNRPDDRRISINVTLPDGNLELSHILQVMLDVAVGLEYLHANNMTSGRLRSENILLTADFRVMFINFAHGLGHERTSAGLFGGKDQCIRFKSPEQFKLDKAPSSDVYSFGVLFWEIFTRRLPYEDITDWSQIIKAIESGQREKIPHYVKPEIKDLILICWDSDPKNRPNALQLVDEITEIASSYGIQLKLDEEPTKSEDVKNFTNSLTLVFDGEDETGEAINQTIQMRALYYYDGKGESVAWGLLKKDETILVKKVRRLIATFDLDTRSDLFTKFFEEYLELISNLQILTIINPSSNEAGLKEAMSKWFPERKYTYVLEDNSHNFLFEKQ